jgi:AraC-like DNA-binding protein
MACEIPCSIEEAEEASKLDELAQSAGLSPYHFHRLFKAITGVTPKAYAVAHRQKRVREKLGMSKSVTEAIYDSGFNSNGRFYADSARVLGMTPSAFREGGVNADIKFAVGECSLGSILVATSDKGVCAISFGDEPDALVRDLQDKFPRARLIGGDADFEQLVAKVVGFVEAPKIGLDLPLDVWGTAFQHRVWPAASLQPLEQAAWLRRAPVGWVEVEKDLDARGFAVIKNLLTEPECRQTASLYSSIGGFRSRVVMAKHGFGRGEYKYFSYPLPALIADLRIEIYPWLARIANRWNQILGIDDRYPGDHPAFLERCHNAGQIHPRRCYWNMAQAITTAYIKIFMAISFFHYKSQSCFLDLEMTSPAVNLF